MFRGGVPYWAQYSADKIGDYLFQMDLQGFNRRLPVSDGFAGLPFIRSFSGCLHVLDCHRQCESRQRIHDAVVT